MGLDFSWTGLKRGNVEVTLEGTSLSLVEPAFNELQRCTGIIVDPYGDSRISPDHARLLMESIAASGAVSDSDVRGLLEMLERAVRDDEWIFVEGD